MVCGFGSANDVARLWVDEMVEAVAIFEHWPEFLNKKGNSKSLETFSENKNQRQKLIVKILMNDNRHCLNLFKVWSTIDNEW